MATKTVTIDTGEWKYPDVGGVTHEVTNGQTFTLELTDGGATNVTYYVDQAQSVTTTDGLTLVFRPETNNNNVARVLGPMTDAQDNTNVYSFRGELVCQDPTSGVVQRWVPTVFKLNDADSPTSITATFEDQYGHKFSWSAVTVS